MIATSGNATGALNNTFSQYNVTLATEIAAWL